MRFSRNRSGPSGAPPAVVLAVTGMHCVSCGLSVDEQLEELPGVLSSATHVRSGRTTLTGELAALTPESVISAVAEAGFRAEILEWPAQDPTAR